MTNPLFRTRLRAVAPMTYAQTILADTPVGFWRCEDALGAATLADSSGNARSLTLNGTRALQAGSRNSRMGRAVSFVGASGYAEVASAAWHQILGNVTCEAWVHMGVQLGTGEEFRIMTNGASGETLATNCAYFFTYQNVAGTLKLRAFHETGAGADSEVTFNYTLPLREWVHLVMTRDVSTKRYDFYVNGANVGGGTYTNDPTGSTTTTLTVNKTAAGAGVTEQNTQMDEIALYNSCLSATRIFEHWRAGRVDPTTEWINTTLLCKFDGADAAVATADESSFGRTWTFSGNAQLDTAQFKFGTASLLLDGTGDFITTPDTPLHQITSNLFTMEAWIRINTGSRVNTILSKRDGAGAEEFSFYVDASNHIVFQPNASGSAIVTLTGSTALSTATWYHVCAQRTSGNVWSVYLNGVVEATSTTAGTSTTNVQGLTIGRNVFNTAQDFNGWIDSVRFTLGVARYAAGGFTAPTVEFNLYE